MTEETIQLDPQAAADQELRRMVAGALAAALSDRSKWQLQTQLAFRIPSSDLPERLALSAIARLGVAFAADDPVRAVEALGAMLINCAVIARWLQLSIVPIIELGRRMTSLGQAQPGRAMGELAAAAIAIDDDVLPPADQLERMTGALALAVAKGLDDVELQHELKIEPLELFELASKDFMDRPLTGWGASHFVHPRHGVLAAAAEAQKMRREAARAAAFASLASAHAELIDGPPRSPGSDRIIVCEDCRKRSVYSEMTMSGDHPDAWYRNAWICHSDPSHRVTIEEFPGGARSSRDHLGELLDEEIAAANEYHDRKEQLLTENGYGGQHAELGDLRGLAEDQILREIAQDQAKLSWLQASTPSGGRRCHESGCSGFYSESDDNASVLVCNSNPAHKLIINPVSHASSAGSSD